MFVLIIAVTLHAQTASDAAELTKLLESGSDAFESAVDARDRVSELAGSKDRTQARGE